jgi:hypothetical protein
MTDSHDPARQRDIERGCFECSLDSIMSGTREPDSLADPLVEIVRNDSRLATRRRVDDAEQRR